MNARDSRDLMIVLEEEREKEVTCFDSQSAFRCLILSLASWNLLFSATLLSLFNMTSNPSSITALIICVTSIYTFFLLWGLLQERITTTAYNLPISPLHPTSQSRQEYFKSPLFLNTVQAFFSTSVAAIYLLFRQATSNDTATSKDAGKTLMQIWGLSALTSKGASQIQKPNSKSTSSNPTSFSPLLSKYLLISLFQSLSSQLGLLSLSHGISYPTLILGKSCKLIPVLLMNLLLYRRKFPPHKYLVVFLVTLGISLFMLFSPSSSSSKKGGGSSSLIGLLLLFSNLMLDGATNSTQDQVFTTHHILGSQMMLIMNLLSFALLSFSLVLPIPYIPLINPNPLMGNELGKALEFIKRHPEIVRDVLAYALAGALGQISIFETLERFGSLTLVSITVSISFLGQKKERID